MQLAYIVRIVMVYNLVILGKMVKVKIPRNPVTIKGTLCTRQCRRR